ncbi:MAG TPA: cytochrome c biogenesis protein CcdA [Candidatus Sumerlaeota bacterium]|nr:cytochrome c biogenesis protein CcdA [Candidatus Sumerlaeota bacterium]
MNHSQGIRSKNLLHYAAGILFIIPAAVMATEAGADAPTGVLMAILIGYGVGFVTAFTPCVWPLYPITFSVIMNSSQARTRGSALGLSVVYVSGLVVTYGILGAISGAIGGLAQNYLKSIWIVIPVSLFLTLFGISMLGLFEISLPASLSTRLMKGGRRGAAGVFIMGLVSGLVLSPCVSPAIGAMMTVVLTSGSALLGGLAFVGFALGMGTLLIVVGTASGALKSLPKPGAWMVWVKRAMGAGMILLAVWLAWPVVAFALKGREDQPAREAGSIAPTASIMWIQDYEDGMARAKAESRPVMLYFTADWCAYCQEMKKETFPDAGVIEESRRFVAITIDGTQLTPVIQAIQTEYSIPGYPAIVFIGTEGERTSVMGFVEAAKLADAMKQVK